MEMDLFITLSVLGSIASVLSFIFAIIALLNANNAKNTANRAIGQITNSLGIIEVTKIIPIIEKSVSNVNIFASDPDRINISGIEKKTVTSGILETCAKVQSLVEDDQYKSEKARIHLELKSIRTETQKLTKCRKNCEAYWSRIHESLSKILSILNKQRNQGVISSASASI